MSDTTKEIIEFVMSVTGAKNIDLRVVLDAIDYIEDLNVINRDAENELILDELNDLLCEYE